MSPRVSGWARLTCLVFVFGMAATCYSADAKAKASLSPGMTFNAVDTLATGENDTDDALKCLEGLRWPAGKFTVTVEEPWKDGSAGTIRFPSAISTDNAKNDLASMEWYAAQKDDQPLAQAPAIVVIHESGSSMPVGRMFAGALAKQGFHTFMLHLPYYGLRRPEGTRPDLSGFLQVMRQGIADARRARDAVAALPIVSPKVIAIHGTSLGGFVTATTAGLDRGYDAAFIMVAGGDLYGVISSGIKEAADLRAKLAAAGLDDDAVREIAYRIEPNRLAHRLRPERTWLYAATADQVVPPASSQSFKKAAKLPDDHFIQLPGDHVSGIVFFPVVVTHTADAFRSLAASGVK